IRVWPRALSAHLKRLVRGERLPRAVAHLVAQSGKTRHGHFAHRQLLYVGLGRTSKRAVKGSARRSLAATCGRAKKPGGRRVPTPRPLHSKGCKRKRNSRTISTLKSSRTG